MTAEESPIVELFRHNLWANLRLLDACGELSEEQLDAIAAGGYGSIRDTLTHMIAAEERYLARLTGKQAEGPLQRGPSYSEAFLGIPVLREHATRSGEGLMAVAPRVGPSDMVRQQWEGQEMEYKASLLLIQAINHATEHRTQIKTILSQHGVEPPELDGWTYLHENQ